MNIEQLDGSLLSPADLRSKLKNLIKPCVITGVLKKWSTISSWTLEDFIKSYGYLNTKFKLYYKDSSSNCKRVKLNNVAMETDCLYCSATFNDFYDWLINDDIDQSNPLNKYSRNEYWCYADYIYLNNFLPDEILQQIDWSIFGFHGYSGKQSTLWVSSEEAYTPCHQDTYGYNLVAQICGVKRWTLFTPDMGSIMKPSRIPYEESSIFSYADIKSLDMHSKSFVVDVQPGEVLYVPKHWWHYVETISSSCISINTWIEHATDNVDRLEESLVQIFAYAFKNSDKDDTQWLNPNQKLPTSLEECASNVQAAYQEQHTTTLEECVSNVQAAYQQQHKYVETLTPQFIFDCLSDKTVLKNLMQVMESRITKINTT